MQVDPDRIRCVDPLVTPQYPFDGPFYQERSAGPRLDQVKIPAYFGSGWYMHELHLKGAFDGYNGTGSIPKRMLVVPVIPR
ncbi:MAG: hypothetical protein A3I02_03755 [Betaproteobacteria bacterium RIFCSPLOWO2_02_FULL_67_26]|nr:MAG: hypothetical protein A3I02_03755 [Betaproteobacteria bacterium RIFCSPLOWO2_02_FULL_67_26]